jgi:hypothetical protein
MQDSVPAIAGKQWQYYNGVWTYMGQMNTPDWGYAFEDSCLDELHPGPPYRSGGNFRKFSYQADPELANVGVWYSKPYVLRYRYEGGFYPQASITTFTVAATHAERVAESLNPFSRSWSPSRAESYGATGWKRFRPGNPTAGLGVFLGELRDLPRMLKGTAKFFRDTWKALGGNRSGFGPKNVANHWLNTQFGWLPFISDLRKFYRTTRSLDARIKRIRSNNGQWCKVGGTVASDQQSDIISSSATLTAHLPAMLSYYYSDASSTGSRVMTRVTSSKAWFEGSFRYYIPDIETVEWERRAVVELFGLFPNPALIWELLPWSWLVDWGSNTGDVIANLTTGYTDNLAAKYAYVMKGTEILGRCESTLRLWDRTLHDEWLFPLSWKERTGANPFGFGLTDNMLSVRQWSILSALGISRLH